MASKKIMRFIEFIKKEEPEVLRFDKPSTRDKYKLWNLIKNAKHPIILITTEKQ